jgi:hypothetical protein
VDALHQPLEVSDGRVGKDAVTQIEDMTRSAIRLGEDLQGASLDQIEGPQ